MIIHDIVKNVHSGHLNQLVGHEIALHCVFKPCMHASATWQYMFPRLVFVTECNSIATDMTYIISFYITYKILSIAVSCTSQVSCVLHTMSSSLALRDRSPSLG